MENLVFMTIITGRKKKDDIVKLLTEAHATTINIVFSRDYIEANLLRYAFGFVPDEDEMCVNCLLSESSADSVFEILYDKYNFKKPKVGTAFTFRIDKIAI